MDQHPWALADPRERVLWVNIRAVDFLTTSPTPYTCNDRFACYDLGLKCLKSVWLTSLEFLSTYVGCSLKIYIFPGFLNQGGIPLWKIPGYTPDEELGWQKDHPGQKPDEVPAVSLRVGLLLCIWEVITSYCCLFKASLMMVPYVWLHTFISPSTVRRQVILGLLLFLFPTGIQVSGVSYTWCYLFPFSEHVRSFSTALREGWCPCG